jgi:pinoresinol/lariciresinol reductase
MTERVLVVGPTGRLGRRFVQALRQEGREVLMLVRPSASGQLTEGRRAIVEALARLGAETIEGCLEDEATVDRACAEVDAVVSCIDHRPDHLALQSALVRAAGRSGSVRRIMPSQFGMDSRVYDQGRVDHGDSKRALQREFDTCGVPVTYVHINGLAASWAASLGQLGLKEPPSHEIEVYGDGDTRLSTVASDDVARYAVRALFDDQAANRHVLISPPQNRLTQNELIATWQSLTGTVLGRRAVLARDLDDRIAAVADRPDRFGELSVLQLIRAAWIDGLGDGRRLPDVLELTALYPDLEYETTERYLERLASAKRVPE